MPIPISFRVNGAPVEVDADVGSLLDVLRGPLGLIGAKDGCSPQGQCGCCTVLIDGQPRVACVTPVARVAGRSITTIEGLPSATEWSSAFCEAGGSQCGFCTPGIIMRLSALTRFDRRSVDQALLAHMCRCTGWQTIHEACELRLEESTSSAASRRNLDAAGRRATIEGRSPQRVDPQVSLGLAGFSDDLAPAGALVAMVDGLGHWHVAETMADARSAAGKVQGRRTTAPLTWPLDAPAGQWTRTLGTTWVEPAYLEPDVVWCTPGADPVAVVANGGAFGPKGLIALAAVARRLADEAGRAVKVVANREDLVRRGAKRPPVAIAVRADGTGVARVVATAGITEAINSMASGLTVEQFMVPGPATSASVRGAGWVEAAVVLASLGDRDAIATPWGSTASAEIGSDGSLRVVVGCGDPLDATVLRSYCIGAAHQALGWVRSEGLAVDAAGEVHDLTIRSFGVLRSIDTPRIEVEIDDRDGPPVNGSDGVFAAVAAAAWRVAGFPARWPLRSA